MSVQYISACGIPASGKSTWACKWVAEDPLNRVRVNKDTLRAMTNNSVWSGEYENLINGVQKSLIRSALKSGRSVVNDNTNFAKQHWTDIVKMVQGMGIECFMSEKPFYIELDEALERDAKREGAAKVGEVVIRKFWKQSGGTQFKHYHPRIETITKREPFARITQDKSLPAAVVFDNDGTISLIHSGRSPYDASTSDLDLPHEHVIECMRNYHELGYKILFVSGREEKDRAPTERFYAKHFPEVKYELYMRPTGDQRKDWIIKDEIYNAHIKPRYFVAGWFDDRAQVCKWVYESGLPLFRVNDPFSEF